MEPVPTPPQLGLLWGDSFLAPRTDRIGASTMFHSTVRPEHEIRRVGHVNHSGADRTLDGPAGAAARCLDCFLLSGRRGPTPRQQEELSNG
jgi:hypothetical protein